MGYEFRGSRFSSQLPLNSAHFTQPAARHRAERPCQRAPPAQPPSTHASGKQGRDAAVPSRSGFCTSTSRVRLPSGDGQGHPQPVVQAPGSGHLCFTHAHMRGSSDGSTVCLAAHMGDSGGRFQLPGLRGQVQPSRLWASGEWAKPTDRGPLPSSLLPLSLFLPPPSSKCRILQRGTGR